MAYALYLLTFASGKSYVGQTVRTLATRIAQHRRRAKSGSKLAVHSAWRVHGEPSIRAIGEFDTQEQLHAAEIAAIQSHGTLSPGGYNLSKGGETAPSKNPGVAAKISAAAIGRKYRDTTVWSHSAKAQWQSPAYRESVSFGLKASWTPERRQALSDRTKAMWAARRADGWTVSQAARDKISKRVITDESRARMSAAAKGKPKAPRSEETKAKLSAATKAAWLDPEVTARRLAAIEAARRST